MSTTKKQKERWYTSNLILLRSAVYFCLTLDDVRNTLKQPKRFFFALMLKEPLLKFSKNF